MKIIYNKLPVLFISLALAACGDGAEFGSDNSANEAASKYTSVTKSTKIDAGEQCPSGGIRIDAGLDKNANKVLDKNEMDHFEIMCNGFEGWGGKYRWY